MDFPTSLTYYNCVRSEAGLKVGKRGYILSEHL